VIIITKIIIAITSLLLQNITALLFFINLKAPKGFLRELVINKEGYNMAVKNDVLLDINGKVFLEELRTLRDQFNGKYISDLFCSKLEHLSYKIAKIIHEQNYQGKILKLNHSQPREKISEQMVGLCLECIEMYLLKIANPEFAEDSLAKLSIVDEAFNVASDCNQSTALVNSDREFNGIMQILVHVACDLRALASYIKFTLFCAKDNQDVWPYILEKSTDLDKDKPLN
jgi:hypothetical protein